MSILYEHQQKALAKMHNGCILYGGVGSGKSRTAIAYYYISNGGDLDGGNFVLKDPRPLYIITTARKRDTADWLVEFPPFGISAKDVVIDSWNNIKKYTDVSDAFFIFDEQRLVGSGAWVKAFYKIAKKNKWILLSATPGDTWTDYIPVFVANGFFKNKTEFCRMHCVFSTHTTYPKIERFVDTGILNAYRRRLLVPMNFERHTERHETYLAASYDRIEYKRTFKDRFDYETGEPFQNAAQLCYHLRKLINSDPSRQIITMELQAKHHKVIIFYNYDYELEILKKIPYGLHVDVAEWNGHKHDLLPMSDEWVYLVQYTAGSEGWNCTTTDTIIFYSENYSYKVMQQAAGRIDRLNTPFTDLYYYHITTTAPIDLSIQRALKNKKKFNEEAFVQGS